MATVYKAKCHVLNRFVAVKILRDEYTTDTEFIKRFNTEAQAAASLTHPNIVSIFDVGNEGNLYYIVMELVQGKTLKEIISEDGALPWKWSVNVAIQIASALEVAHKNGIVHRDIKPHNIIITEEGVAKVTDFGIAKAVSNSTITAFGTTIGSVHYFSPEHARGGFTDAKSDLYSLGVVMYEMVTGRVPFDADTPVSVALKQMQEIPKEPIKLQPSLPISVNNIIMKALEKDPNTRYQSATDMLKDLTLCLKKPEENIAEKKQIEGDLPTQRVPIINSVSNEENKKPEKKKNKVVVFFEKHKVLKVFAFIIGAILLFAMVMGITYLITNSLREKDVPIINLEGMSLEEAKAELEKIKVNLEVEKEEFDAEVPEGYIISQNPKYRENYKIKEKSTIKVVVSKGKELVKVTKFVGMKKEDAVQAIKDLGLVEEVIEEISTTVEAGIVIRQEPEVDTEAETGSTVKIYVSKGNGITQVEVPDVVNQTEEQAVAVLEARGLKVEKKYRTDTTKSAGMVLEQDVDAKTMVDEGTTVTITINQLPEVKQGTVNVYVRSLTGYQPQKDENGVTIEPENVEVRIVVGEDVQFKESFPPDTEKVTANIQGIGNVIVKVYVDDVMRKTQTIDLNSNNTVLDVR